MVFETVYNGNGLYYETVDDAADIAAAFKSGHTVTLHFPADLEAPNGSSYANTEFYIQMSGYQPETLYNDIVINPEVFMFSVLNKVNGYAPVNYAMRNLDYCFVVGLVRNSSLGKLRFQQIGK